MDRASGGASVGRIRRILRTRGIVEISVFVHFKTCDSAPSAPIDIHARKDSAWDAGETREPKRMVHGDKLSESYRRMAPQAYVCANILKGVQCIEVCYGLPEYSHHFP